ncbi:MAG: hypothetical protein IKG18_16300 [Atopobiaceae bacterium]|nr:hypothetical protein [Atopobiaceae bacterium]MBR3315686.1 hypothetical protein [Atopobiaceae bacterium]
MARSKEAATRKTGVAGWNEAEGTGRRSAQDRGKRTAADRRRRMAVIALVLVCCVGSIICAMPMQERITRGLWFKGGTAQTMTASKELGSDEQSTAVSTIKGRLGAIGLAEYAVDPSGNDSVVIKLPWNLDGKRIAESVGGAGVLEFVRVDEIGDADALTLLNAGAKDVTLKEGTYTPFLSNKDVTSCETTLVSDGVYAVTITFDEKGAETFADVTEELAKDHGAIAIVVDGNVISAPGVSERIEGGQVSISGGFTQEEAGALKAVLDSQQLPTNLKLTDSQDIGPLAGEGTLRGIAIGAAVAAIAVGVAAYVKMRKTGLIVLATELVLAALMLGLMAITSSIEVYVLTITSLICGGLTCACGVCASWLVAHKFLALAKSGKSVRGSSLSAVSDSLKPFALPVACVGVISIVFLFLPMGLLREIGLSVLIGLVASIVAILVFEGPLLRVLATGAMQKDAASWGIVVDVAEAPSASTEAS